MLYRHIGTAKEFGTGSFWLAKELGTRKFLFSAEGAAIYQPSPQGWVRGQKAPKRAESPT
jgi:hypothetical protein